VADTLEADDMPDPALAIETIKASEARTQWSQLLNRVFHGQARVVVEQSGIPVAAIISADDLERFTCLEQQRAEHFKALDRIRDAFRDVPDDELEREVQKAVEQARLEERQRQADPQP
jgi:prevent-host-death family protein